MTLPHQPTDAEAELEVIFNNAEYDVEGCITNLPVVEANILAWHKQTALAEFEELIGPPVRPHIDVTDPKNLTVDEVVGLATRRGMFEMQQLLRQAAVKKYGEAE
jgi:hypothetical protein